MARSKAGASRGRREKSARTRKRQQRTSNRGKQNKNRHKDKYEQWRRETEEAVAVATTSLVRDGSLPLISTPMAETWGGVKHVNESGVIVNSVDGKGHTKLDMEEAMEEARLAAALGIKSKKPTAASRKAEALVTVKKRMRRAQLADPNINPTSLGLPSQRQRAESTRTVPPTLKRWMKAKPSIAPILRASVSDKSSAFPTSGVGLSLSKSTPTLTGPLVGAEEGFPEWTRWDWGGGLSAGEFALPAAKADLNRRDLPHLSAEMEQRLYQHLHSNLGRGIWDDQVGSQLARPLDASIFCSVDLQHLQHGVGPKFDKRFGVYDSVGAMQARIGPYVDSKVRMLPSRASTTASSLASIGTANSADLPKAISSSEREDQDGLLESRGSEYSRNTIRRIFTPPVKPKRADDTTNENFTSRYATSHTPPSSYSHGSSARLGHTLAAEWWPQFHNSSDHSRIGTPSSKSLVLSKNGAGPVLKSASSLDSKRAEGNRPRTVPAEMPRRPPRTPVRVSVPSLSPRKFPPSRCSTASVGSSVSNDSRETALRIGYSEDTARRPIYSSGSLPDTFRTGFSQVVESRSDGVTKVGEYSRLPRGLSRTRLAYTYERFPYSMVAHQAATIMQHVVRRHQAWRTSKITKVQAAVRSWKAKRIAAGRREEYEAALTVIQRNARIYLARLQIRWMKSISMAHAARRIQALHRGNAGRKAAAAWKAFVWNRSARTAQKAWHACKGRYRASLRRYWLKDQYFRANTIQRFWRGYHYGRLKVYKIRLWAILQLQRISRGMLGRLRSWNVILYRAAADIQRTLCRGVQDRHRAKLLYQARVEKERKRRLEEDKRVAQAVEKAVADMETLLDKVAGDKSKRRAEMRRAKRELESIRRDKRKQRKLMSLKDRKRMRVEDVFRSYDIDNGGTSATIPLEALPLVIQRLCIPLSSSEIERASKLLQAPKREDDSINDAVAAASKPDLTPNRVRFEEFWTLLSVELGHAQFDSDEGGLIQRPLRGNQLQARGSVVSEGQLTNHQTNFLQAKLRAAQAFRNLTGKTRRESAERYLLEHARKNAVKNARASFRDRPERRPAFECPKCMRPFAFDYEVTRHQASMKPDCESFDTYDSLRALEKSREKARREEELATSLARAAERRAFEAFRRRSVAEDQSRV